MRDIEKRLRRVDKIIKGKPLERGSLRSKTSGLTAERLYTNQKVSDLVSKAETEQSDYRRQSHVNIFFGPIKRYVGMKMSIFSSNAGVLILSSLVLLISLYLILKRQLRTRGA